MANLRVLDAVADDKYLKASGAGTDGDPHIPQHLETNSAAILTAAQAIQAAAEAIKTAVETLDNVVAGSEAQVDVVSMPSTAVTGPLTDAELRASAVPVSGTVTASGPLTDTELRNTAVPVSAATLPLPTGAATSAKQDTEIGHLATLAGVVAGTEAQVDVLSSALPTGASTAANQATLIGHVDGVETLLGTIDADTSALAGAVAGTEMQVDIVAALPAGTNAIGATRDAGPSWTSVYGVSGAVVTSADASTATAVTDAPTGGQKLVITDIVLSVGATAMQCDLELETAGTVYLTTYMAANSTVQITPRSKLKLGTADKKLMLDTSAAGAVSCTVWYYSEA